MGRFKPGESGNPKGKPKGTLHKATRAAQELLDGEAQDLTRKCIELAKEGNPLALKLYLERLIPPRKDRPIKMKLPKVINGSDLPKVLQTVMRAVAEGEITPGEGQAIMAMLEALRKGIELTTIEARLAALEEKINHEGH
jgi:hypothetical protein